MRSAPTLKICMTPFASVAMLEKLALLKIALCRAPVVSRASEWPEPITAPFAPGVRRSEGLFALVISSPSREEAFVVPGDEITRQLDNRDWGVFHERFGG